MLKNKIEFINLKLDLLSTNMQVYVLVFLTLEYCNVIGVFDTKLAAKERLIMEAIDWNCYMSSREREKLKKELIQTLKEDDEFVNCAETGSMWRIETKTMNI
jgi:hypothetical protein